MQLPPMAADPMARHYAALAAPGRFKRVVEGKARRDAAEADRLEGARPRPAYRTEDAGFRQRTPRA